MCDQNLKQLIQESLRTFENDPKLKVAEINLTEGSKLGDNYMSVVNCVDVYGQTGSGADYYQSLFIKKPPSNSERCQLFSIDKAFKNEKLMYKEYFPKVIEFDIPIPKCIHADDNVILLENLKTCGYRMANRRECLDLAHCRLSIKALAKFHSSSYFLKTMKNDELDEFLSKVNYFAMAGSFYSRMVEGAIGGCLRVLRTHENDPTIATVIPKIDKLVGVGLETMESVAASDGLSVMCHGDYWMNNLLYRHDAGSVLTDVAIVDFQAPRLLSFAVDLWTFIYVCAKPSLLQNSIEELVRLYFDTFVSSIKNKLPESRIPRYDDVMSELRGKQLYGFLVAMLYIPALFVDSTTVSDFDKMMSGDVSKSHATDVMQLPKEYDDRVLTIVRHCDSHGVFDKC